MKQLEPPDLIRMYADQYARSKPLPTNEQEFFAHLYLFAKGVCAGLEQQVAAMHRVATDALNLKTPTMPAVLEKEFLADLQFQREKEK